MSFDPGAYVRDDETDERRRRNNNNCGFRGPVSSGAYVTETSTSRRGRDRRGEFFLFFFALRLRSSYGTRNFLIVIIFVAFLSAVIDDTRIELRFGSLAVLSAFQIRRSGRSHESVFTTVLRSASESSVFSPRTRCRNCSFETRAVQYAVTERFFHFYKTLLLVLVYVSYSKLNYFMKYQVKLN